MRIVRFRDDGGSVRRGEWTDDDVIEFGGEEYDPDAVDILPTGRADEDRLRRSQLHRAHQGSGAEHSRRPPAASGILPERPQRGRRPRRHREAADSGGDARGTRRAGEGDIELGRGRMDYEGEFGVVIGEQCRNVSEDDYMDVVAGYTCLNDVSNRDDQDAERNWVRGKAFDNSAPIGPVMATPEDVPEEPRVRLWLNGEKRQDSDDDELVFDVGRAISEVSTFLTLEPGDIVAMGTTVGVGPQRR